MIKDITIENRAYFAGLFDGEGTVRISKHKTSKTDSVSYGLEVSFGITYKNVLIEMKEFFYGTIYKEDMKKVFNCISNQKRMSVEHSSPEKWKQIYRYKLHGRDALYFLKVIEPFCREKKRQAALGIRYEEGRRPFAGSYGRSESETNRCEFFYKELMKMKHEILNEP